MSLLMALFLFSFLFFLGGGKVKERWWAFHFSCCFFVRGRGGYHFLYFFGGRLFKQAKGETSMLGGRGGEGGGVGPGTGQAGGVGGGGWFRSNCIDFVHGHAAEHMLFVDASSQNMMFRPSLFKIKATLQQYCQPRFCFQGHRDIWLVFSGCDGSHELQDRTSTCFRP